MSHRIRLVVAAIALSSAPWLHAQGAGNNSVNLFGRIDMGIENINSGAGSVTAAKSGTYTASRLGFRGQEEISSDLSALFHLEMGINADTGSLQSTAKTFNRGSYVGLSSKSAGTLTLGRQYVPIFWPFLFGEQAGRHRLHGYSAVQSVQRNSFARIDAGASPLTDAGTLNPVSGGRQTVGITSAFEDGLFVYKTPNFGPVSATVAYARGVAGGAHQDGRVVGGNLQYNDQGRYLGLGFNRKNGTVSAGGTQQGQVLTETLVSGLYPLGGGLSVWGNYHPWSLKSAGQQLKGRDAMVGLSYQTTSGMLWANYAHKRLRNCDHCNSDGFGVGYHHHLSPRTELYVSYGHVGNQGHAAASLNGTTPAVNGKSVRALALGVAHTF